MEIVFKIGAYLAGSLLGGLIGAILVGGIGIAYIEVLKRLRDRKERKQQEQEYRDRMNEIFNQALIELPQRERSPFRSWTCPACNRIRHMLPNNVIEQLRGFRQNGLRARCSCGASLVIQYDDILEDITIDVAREPEVIRLQTQELVFKLPKEKKRPRKRAYLSKRD